MKTISKTISTTEYMRLPERDLGEGGDIRLLVSAGYRFIPNGWTEHTPTEGSVVAIIHVVATTENDTGLWTKLIYLVISNYQDDRVLI